jgi:hypothetical protein
MHRSLVLGLATVITAGLAALSGFQQTPTPTSAENTVGICHLTGNGDYIFIEVNQNAVPAHLAHGDFRSSSARLCATTPTRTVTRTNTPTNTPVPPTFTRTNTPTGTPVPPTLTRTNTPTSTGTAPAITPTRTNTPPTS